MASRLSDVSVKATLNCGHRSLPWNQQDMDSIMPRLDLAAIGEREDVAQYVPTLPAAQLYYSLVQRGVEDSMAVLQHVSAEQLVKILDYDVWQEDRLEAKDAYRWLKTFKHFGLENLAQRYRQLDEEYQLALVQGKVRVYDEEEIEKMPDHQRDMLLPLPCHQFFYEVVTDDKDDEEFIISLIESALSTDIPYAYSLLAHGAYGVPNEAEAQLSQFRRARIEEDGFVTYEESIATLQPVDAAPLLSKYKADTCAYEASLPVSISNDGAPFLARVKAAMLDAGVDETAAFNLEAGFVFVANSLCSSEGLEPDDVPGIVKVLQQTRALAGLGLEYITGSDISAAMVAIQTEHPKTLINAALSLVAKLQVSVISALRDAGCPHMTELDKYQKQRRHGEALYLIDTQLTPILGIDLGERLKGIFNRLPMRAQASQDGQKITFEPIYSLGEYQQTAASILQMCTELRTIH